jgi:hypothetical protein
VLGKGFPVGEVDLHLEQNCSFCLVINALFTIVRRVCMHQCGRMHGRHLGSMTKDGSNVEAGCAGGAGG